MRNRFKPNLTNSRTGRNSTSSSDVNAGENISSDASTANIQVPESPSKNDEDPSSGNVSTSKQEQDKAEQLKTATSSSVAVSGSTRRSRIKPAVAPVLHARTKSTIKDKTIKAEAKHVDGDTKGTNVSSSQSHATSCTNDQFPSSEQQERNVCESAEEVFRPPSLNERNQQANNLTKWPSATSLSVTNNDQHPVRPEVEMNQSQEKGGNTDPDSVTTQGNDGGGAPSLLRRKRVLPNLGSASRRRHSSISKENIERTPELVEVRHEELDVSGKDPVDFTDQSSVEGSGNSNKRLRSLSQGEKTADHGAPPSSASDAHSKEDDDVEQENSKRKGVKRKRSTRSRKLKEPSDPSQMTMQHLIYYNPKTNPMTSKVEGNKKRDGRTKTMKHSGDKDLEQRQQGEDGSQASTSSPQNSKEPSAGDTEADEADGASVAPQVKLDADGNIILDEESLVIDKSSDKTVENSEIVYEDANEVNFGAYLKHRKVGRWSLEETQKFYKALSQVGTDFSLMLPLFPKRARRELKAKFKREEKLHRDLVEKALRVRNPIDVELFTPKVEGEEIDDDLNSENNNS